MTTETLDARIRQVVVQIVDTAPAPTPFDALAPKPANHARRPAVVVALASLSVIAIVAAVIALVAVLGSDNTATPNPADGGRAHSSLTIRALASITYDRTTYTVGAGTVRLTLTGALGHTLRFDDPRLASVLIATDSVKGRSTKVRLSPGSYTIYCTVPGHRAAGMEATIRVLPRPIRWIAPNAPSVAALTLPPLSASLTDLTVPPERSDIGDHLAALLQRALPHGSTKIGTQDVSAFEQLGDLGRATFTMPDGSVLLGTVFRLPTPTGQATLSAGVDSTLDATTRGSQLLRVGDQTVYLVRSDGTTLQLTSVDNADGTTRRVPVVELEQLAKRLDTDALSVDASVISGL